MILRACYGEPAGRIAATKHTVDPPHLTPCCRMPRYAEWRARFLLPQRLFPLARDVYEDMPPRLFVAEHDSYADYAAATHLPRHESAAR